MLKERNTVSQSATQKKFRPGGLEISSTLLLLWVTYTAVRVSTLPEWACRRLESECSCSADGVGRESSRTVILRGDNPLPESSASFTFFRRARCGVRSSGTHIGSVCYLTRDRVLSSFRLWVVATLPVGAGNTCAGSHKSCLSLSSDWSIPATLKCFVQLLCASIAFAVSIRARDTDCVGKLLRFGRSYSFPESCCLTSLLFLDSDWLDACSIVNTSTAIIHLLPSFSMRWLVQRSYSAILNSGQSGFIFKFLALESFFLFSAFFVSAKDCLLFTSPATLGKQSDSVAWTQSHSVHRGRQAHCSMGYVIDVVFTRV